MDKFALIAYSATALLALGWSAFIIFVIVAFVNHSLVAGLIAAIIFPIIRRPFLATAAH